MTKETADMTIEEVLTQRGEVYGDYTEQNKFRSVVLRMTQQRYEKEHGLPMPIHELTRIYDIINKLSRLTVSPNHLDTWKDISGYATLAHEAIIQERENADK